MAEEDTGDRPDGVQVGGGGLTSPREEEVGRAVPGDSDQDEQAAREGVDQLDTTGTQ